MTLEQAKALYADLVRPTALLLTAAGGVGALFAGVHAAELGVVFGALTVMYGAKALETVGVAKAQAGGTPAP